MHPKRQPFQQAEAKAGYTPPELSHSRIPPENIRGAEALKRLTGCDFIEAEFKGGNTRASLMGAFNILITSNNRLRVRLDGDEEAWRRRLLLVKFESPPVKKKFADFAKILVRDEGKGILNWLINGAQKALADIADGKSIKLPESLQKMQTACSLSPTALITSLRNVLSLLRERMCRLLNCRLHM